MTWVFVGFGIAIASSLVGTILLALVFSALVVKAGRFLDDGGTSFRQHRPESRGLTCAAGRSHVV
jgi:hypothetical protein